MQFLGEDLAPERDSVDPLDIAILQRHHGADADLLVGLDDDIQMVGIERVQRHHVLHGGHARAQTFERAEQRPRLDLLAAALGIGRWQCQKTPGFQRYFFQGALGQRVV